MKKIVLLLCIAFSFYGCENNISEDEFERINWNARAADVSGLDSLEVGKSYLSIYSQIYSLSQHKKYNLTAMASLRNTSETDTIYLLKADYHGTHGEIIKQYIEKPVYLLPMETLDIVIEESDVSGGTGSNFIFDWITPKDCSEPIFEAVMSSTVGSQGLSFTTQSKRIN
ncbi:DUF3124 domain-containing protein [Winogradskyella echinorum]|uniref:DUF3124 domain-containing protein n=1 Tax=Winogradskyella echinorum TaxID=538189 RepID=A0ABR6Y2M7_9FLAO|nr:DUF3124 domain-containing protein [Winogradskyella echinorum]MBC3847002.1 DUF3124 domain-containing protein [Winogradskyella echinorum]MBC5751350.1 DUF3124 domain-containing protein [Winogradskyella echinorum]